MSKWTGYQLGIIVLAGLILFIRQFLQQNTDLLTTSNFGNQSTFILSLLTIVGIIWGCASLFLLENKKGKELFKHRIWRIMPAISGGLLVISAIGLIILGLTVYSSISADAHWQLDLLITYFLALFYVFILSIIIRYGKRDSPSKKIVLSANSAIVILIVVFWFFPSL